MQPRNVVTSVEKEQPTHTASPMFWQRALVCVGCGALLSLALPTSNLWPFFAALTPLFILVANSRRLKDAFGYGFFFGVACFALHIIWLPQSFADPEVYGLFFWLLYPPMLVILGCFWGIVTGLSRLVGRRGAGTLTLLPVLWVLMEVGTLTGVICLSLGDVGLYLDGYAVGATCGHRRCLRLEFVDLLRRRSTRGSFCEF